eukprot:scaffold166075_cov37-Tisochrysis_lutea.AAC.1
MHIVHGGEVRVRHARVLRTQGRALCGTVASDKEQKASRQRQINVAATAYTGAGVPSLTHVRAAPAYVISVFSVFKRAILNRACICITQLGSYDWTIFTCREMT